MKPTNRITPFPRMISFLLAAAMLLCLASCGAPADSISRPDADAYNKYEAYIPRDANGNIIPYVPTNKGISYRGKFDPKFIYDSELERYGKIETLVKSVNVPSAPADGSTRNETRYGVVDWSDAANGYITFTAAGSERVFYMEGPNTGSKVLFTVPKGNSIKIALADGAGRYQYAIGYNNSDGRTYHIQYKNSFTVKAIDSDLAPFLVSTPYGDYANAPVASAKAKEAWRQDKDQLRNVQTLAEWLTNNLEYDSRLKQGSVDVYVAPDSVIANGGGVCNEFAKLLVAMLRSQGVPAHYQSGIDDEGISHAWVLAWVESSTYVQDGKTWSRGAWVAIESTGGYIMEKEKYATYKIDSWNCVN